MKYVIINTTDNLKTRYAILDLIKPEWLKFRASYPGVLEGKFKYICFMFSEIDVLREITRWTEDTKETILSIKKYVTSNDYFKDNLILDADCDLDWRKIVEFLRGECKHPVKLIVEKHEVTINLDKSITFGCTRIAPEKVKEIFDTWSNI